MVPPSRLARVASCSSIASAASQTGPTPAGSSSPRSPSSTAATSSCAGSAPRTGWPPARTPPTSSALEQRLNVFVELDVQHLAAALPVVPALLGFLYVALHFAGTAAALTWVHRRHPHAFPFLRTTLIVSTGARARRLRPVPGSAAAPGRPRLRRHGQHAHRPEPQLRPARQPLQPDRGRPEPALRLLADRRRRDRAARVAPLDPHRRRRVSRADAARDRRHRQPLPLRRLRRAASSSSPAGSSPAGSRRRRPPARRRPRRCGSSPLRPPGLRKPRPTREQPDPGPRTKGHRSKCLR